MSDIADLKNALEEFYENAVHNAAEKTNTSEQQIREWCEAGNSHETFDEYLRGSAVCYKAFFFFGYCYIPLLSNQMPISLNVIL